jgi:hypothetical protein
VFRTDQRVTISVELSLAGEHRRGHGALYDGVNASRIDVGRLEVSLAGPTPTWGPLTGGSGWPWTCRTGALGRTEQRRTGHPRCRRQPTIRTSDHIK